MSSAKIAFTCKYKFNQTHSNKNYVCNLICRCRTLFIDFIVQTGSNPAVLLIKELIETEQITGHKANFALLPLGYYAKSPTRELLRELVVCYL